MRVQGDLVVAVQYVHCDTSNAVEWLKPVGVKRKRGHSMAKGFAWGGHKSIEAAALRASPGAPSLSVSLFWCAIQVQLARGHA